MEQKKCPQCKNLISISAPTCLYCGRPNKFITKEYINKKWNKEDNKFRIYNIISLKKLLFILVIFTVIVIIKYN